MAPRISKWPFVLPGQKGHWCRGTQAPSPPLSWHFHRPPPVLCSQSTGFGHGDSRNTNESIPSGILSVADRGKTEGATSWCGRLPAMHLVSTPDPNPGRAPRARREAAEEGGVGRERKRVRARTPQIRWREGGEATEEEGGIRRERQRTPQISLCRPVLKFLPNAAFCCLRQCSKFETF